MKTTKMISSTVLLASVIALQTTIVSARTPVSAAQAKKHCDVKKQQKLQATKDQKTGKIIYHCVYTGKIAKKKAWKLRMPSLSAKKSSHLNCSYVGEKGKKACPKPTTQQEKASQSQSHKSKSKSNKG